MGLQPVLPRRGLLTKEICRLLHEGKVAVRKALAVPSAALGTAGV